MTAGTAAPSARARGIKKVLPNAKIIGVDPEGSILAGPGEIRSYKVEGIATTSSPTCSIVRWSTAGSRATTRLVPRGSTADSPRRPVVRRLERLCGVAALQVARDMKPGQRVVVILPDSIRNYLSKFVSDAWMRQHGFLQSDWEIGTMAISCVRSVSASSSRSRSMRRRARRGAIQGPRHLADSSARRRSSGRHLTELDVMQQLVSSRVVGTTTVAEAMVRRVATVSITEPAVRCCRFSSVARWPWLWMASVDCSAWLPRWT